MAVTVTSHVVLLERETDIYVACEHAAGLAAAAGFDRYACADIETAVSEICSNTVRHAEAGWVAIRLLAAALEVVVTDRGPGFDGPRRSAPGLGIGLEGARRLMGELTITRLADGSRVTMSRSSPGSERVATPAPATWSITGVFRTRTGQAVCGDAMTAVELADGSVRVAVADGLGAGEHAALASGRVLDTMDLTAQKSPAAALARADVESRDTRGAAAAVVHLHPDGEGLHAAIGDVSCQMTSSGEPFLSRPGIVGAGIREPADTSFNLSPDSAVIFWTDGVRPPPDGWRRRMPATGPGLEWMERMVVHHGDPADDGALVVVRPR